LTDKPKLSDTLEAPSFINQLIKNMASLQIYLLGNFHILVNHQKIRSDLWQSRQLRTILKLLIIQRSKPVPANQIIEKIWPDKAHEKAAQHLYVRISQIRNILKKFGLQDCIQTIAGGYIFQCEPNLEENGERSFWIDVDEFERMADQGREHLENKAFNHAITHFKKAINLYSADFLIEDLYEDWTISERERLRDRHLMVLTEMAEAYAQTGRYRHAIDVCQKVLSVDPCRESTFVQLMLYYYHLGERSKSLEVFERCQKTLSEEMEVDPDSYTQELAQKIRAGELGGNNGNGKYPPSVYAGRLFEVPYSLSETPFVGRELEFSWLVEQLQSPPPSIVWVNGESGVGKTRLLEEFIRHIADKQTKVITIHARSIEKRPYAIWIATLEKYSHTFDLLALSPENRKVINTLLSGESQEPSLLDNPSHQSISLQMQHALVDVFQKNLPQGSILWIDDIHLADAASLSLVEILAKKIFILLSSMTEEEHDNPFFEEFLRKQSKFIQSLAVQRWQSAQVTSFLEKLSGSGMPVLSESLYAITGGNPLFLINTLQHCFEEGIVYVNHQGEWLQTQPIHLAGSNTIENLISIRLNKNSKDEQSILDVVAVAGGDCDYEILQDVLEFQETKLLDLTDNLIQRGLLIEPRRLGEAELSFSHFIYKEVIYRSLPKPRLKRFHKRIGDAMVHSGHTSGQYCGVLAHHFSSGGDDKKAAQYSLAAGEYLLSMYAPQQAISYYEKAIQWYVEQKNLEALGKSYFGLAETLRLTGESTHAIENYQLAIPMLIGEIKQAAIYQIFQLRVLQGNPLSTYQEIADSAEHSITEEGLSWALPLLFWSHSFVFLLMGYNKNMRLYHAKGWRIARQLCAAGNVPPTWIYNRALSLMMRAHNQWGNYHISIHFSQKNLALLPSSTQDVNIKAVIDASLGESYYNLGAYQKAKNAYQSCYKLASKAGDLRLQGESLVELGFIAFEMGDFDCCLEYTKKVLALVQKKLDVLRYIQAIYLQAKVAIALGKFDTELQNLENILKMARFQQSDPYIAKTLILIAEVYLVQGRTEQAKIFALEAREISEQCKLKREISQANRLCGLVAQQKNDLKAAIAYIDKAIKIAKQISAPFEIGLSLRARSQIEPSQHSDDLKESLLIFDQIGAVFEYKHTQELINRTADDQL
jgi:DNA-binding SARP family transcriptional activator